MAVTSSSAARLRRRPLRKGAAGGCVPAVASPAHSPFGSAHGETFGPYLARRICP